MTHNVAGGWVHIAVNMDSLEEIESDLKALKDKSTIVLRSAINNAAKEINLRLLRGNRKKYTYRNRTELSNLHSKNIKKATVSKMYATIVIRDKIGEVYKYKTSPLRVAVPKGQPYNPPPRYQSKVERASGMKTIALFPGRKGDKYKSFVVKFPKTGHITLAQRQPGTHMNSDPSKEKIKSLYAPSVPKADMAVYDESIAKDTYKILESNIQKQIERTKIRALSR